MLVVVYSILKALVRGSLRTTSILEIVPPLLFLGIIVNKPSDFSRVLELIGIGSLQTATILFLSFYNLFLLITNRNHVRRAEKQLRLLHEVSVEVLEIKKKSQPHDKLLKPNSFRQI
jgi:hypothetical protein